MNITVIKLARAKAIADSWKLIFEWQLGNLKAQIEEDEMPEWEDEQEDIASILAKHRHILPNPVGYVDR